MPSPDPTPTKNKGKEGTISPTPHRGCTTPGKTCKSDFKNQQQKNKQQKTPLQTSRHLSSILAGLKIKLKDQGQRRGNAASLWVPRD